MAKGDEVEAGAARAASRARMFRDEALRRAEGSRGEGELLQLWPAWTTWTYGVLVAFFGVGVAYAAFGTIHEYASGPAVVWVTGRINVTATAAGTVSSIDVKPGQRVEAGARIARFASAREDAELERITRELDLSLVKVLRDPLDQAARQAIAALRAQKDLAAARVEQLSIRAPEAGVVGDVRIRPGQLLEAGETVVTLVSERTATSIVAMLPAPYRPQLKPGMSLRFEVTGYRYAYQEMSITSVSAQIIGPGEVRRFLGQEIEDTVKVEGPVVLVEARPTAPSFTVDGRTLDFYHGMNGTAEARVRAESILVALIPSLRVVIEGLRG